jgi:hypothetical protein
VKDGPGHRAGGIMLGLSKYRLKERGAPHGIFDFLDPESGQVVGVARAPKIPPKGWSLWTTLGFGGRDFDQRPRLTVHRADDDALVFKLRKASGMMNDSRRVYDVRGELIAHFRSGFKTTLAGGFGIIDLAGLVDDHRDIGDQPWLGHVELAGSAFRFSLVCDRDAGRIALHILSTEASPPTTFVRALVEHYDIEAAPELQNNQTAMILLLAAALAVAWWPPED